MTLGPPTRLTCPHCGKSKYILSIASGNTFGATHWSDTKHDYPMLRHPSSVQRCPHCGGYFFYEDAKPVDCNPDALSEKHSLTDWDAEWSGDAGNATISEKKDRKRYWERWEKANANGFGDLTFGETDAAFDGLYASADKARQQMLLFMWLYSFNDTFGGRQMGTVPNCPPAVLEQRKFVVEELCQRIEGSNLLLAELHREMGDFEACIRIAKEPSPDVDSSLGKIISEQIIAHAKAGDTNVFELDFSSYRE